MSVGEAKCAELWRTALADAGIDPTDAMLLALPGEESGSGYRAKHWCRYVVINDPDDVEALDERLAVANSDSNRGLRRVAVWTAGRSSEGLAATMRHELEHSIQLEVHGQGLQQLHERALSMLIEHAGGLPGSNVLYQRIPMEADANAAAARFVRGHFGDGRVDSLVEAGDPDVAALRRQPPPLPLDGLRARMRQFINETGPNLAKEFLAPG